MSWEWIVAVVIGFFAFVWRQAIKFHRSEMDRQKRELVFKAEVERTEREIQDKSLDDVVRDVNEHYNSRKRE